MKLSDKRALFTIRIAQLIVGSYGMSIDGVLYRVRLDYVKRNTAGNKAAGGHSSSTHLHGLAADLTLDKNMGDGWLWVTSSLDPAWTVLHDRWDTMGGSKRIKKDMGHFSFKHQGVR